MSDFSLQATSRTPAIHLNTADMTLVISGESYPEDVRQFYTTINEQLAVYFTTKPERLDVAIKLTYFNSGSARALMELLDQLDEAAEKGVKIIVSWDLDENGNIVRFELPFAIVGNTTRLYVRRINVEEESVLATLPSSEKSISAEMMNRRLAFPTKETLRLVGSGAMEGQRISDGIRNLPELDEAKIRGSMKKKRRQVHNRDSNNYEDRNLYEHWFEFASVDVHGPYTRSITGARYFVLVHYSTGLSVVRCIREQIDSVDAVERMMSMHGRVRHIGLDSGSSNYSSNPDIISGLEKMLSRHGVVLKAAAADAQWENADNEITGRTQRAG